MARIYYNEWIPRVRDKIGRINIEELHRLSEKDTEGENPFGSIEELDRESKLYFHRLKNFGDTESFMGTVESLKDAYILA